MKAAEHVLWSAAVATLPPGLDPNERPASLFGARLPKSGEVWLLQEKDGKHRVVLVEPGSANAVILDRKVDRWVETSARLAMSPDAIRIA